MVALFMSLCDCARFAHTITQTHEKCYQKCGDPEKVLEIEEVICGNQAVTFSGFLPMFSVDFSLLCMRFHLLQMFTMFW